MASALENKDAEELNTVLLVKYILSICCASHKNRHDLLERCKIAPEANDQSNRPQKRSVTGSWDLARLSAAQAADSWTSEGQSMKQRQPVKRE